MKPLVLLDCDGILADFVGAVLDFIEKTTGTRPQREVIRTWDIWENLEDKKLQAAFFEHAGKPGFCADLAPFPAAIEGFPRLAEVADVHIVTSPWHSPTWTFERDGWLLEHFGIPASRVHHEASKHLTRGDYLIDDHPKHIRDWLLNRRDDYIGQAFLWDTPHNRLEQGLWRIRTWDELLAIVTTKM